MLVCHVNLAKGFRGGERQTEILVRELAHSGEVSQILLVRKASILGARLRGCDGVHVVELSRPRSLSARRYLKQASIVHAHEAKAVKLAASCNTPFIVTRRILKQPKTNWFSRRGYRQASRVVCISSAVKKEMQSWDGELNYPVIGDAHANMTPHRGALDGLRACWAERYVIGHVGALVDADKAQSDLVAALKLLRQHQIDACLVLVGEGPDRGALEELAVGLPVYFAGHVENVADYLASFDVFAFPSLQEGMGSSILDAMYVGVPVVASNVGGIPDIVEDGVNGILIPARQPVALSEALATLIQDAAMAEQLVEKAKKTADKFATPNMAQHYLTLYADVLG